MNRGNILIHIGIAIVLIALAAVLGQIGRWRTALKVQDTTPKRTTKSVPQSPSVSGAEVLVRFKKGTPLTEIRNIAAQFNDRVEDSFEYVDGVVAIDDLDNANVEDIISEYKRLGDKVEYVESNFEIRLEKQEVRALKPSTGYDLAGSPNDPLFSEQWALNNTGQKGGTAQAHLDMLKAWAKTKGSADVVVAVLDTGVDYNHEDLRANMWTRPKNVPQYVDAQLGTFDDRNGYNAQANSGDPLDDNGHGTHVAGIIGADSDNGIGIAGINHKVQIMPLKFLGRGGYGNVKDAIEAINYAIDRKKNGVNLRVINASWGSTSSSKALEDAIRAASEAGILFVAAAGNSSTDNDRRPHYPSNYDLPNMISVAALDRNDQLASFSNYGAKTVHIAAPGREIDSTWLKDDYREASGTSMAAPQVAGIAALILSSEPNLSMAKLRERILKSVDKLDTLSGKVAVGGRLNASKALGN